MLKLHNTLSNQLEEFKPLNGNNVTMYVCGPTVYDYPHLGHARCYITWDMLYRFLKFLGYDVKYCRNVTDVDDKILAKAHNENSTAEAISSKYYQIFADAMKALNTLKPDFEPGATKTLGEMIGLIKILIAKGFAYEADGDVYFRVKNFKEYGKLSKQPIDDLEAGARVETSGKKEDALDFALWKKDEENGYKSPWGIGRPGWHIECSAMSKKYLGEQIDIHAGGADLIFPHHENEIAQSEGASGKEFAHYWMHNAFINVDNQKMSKSLNNFFTVREIAEVYGYEPIRYFLLTARYRMPLNYTTDIIAQCKSSLASLYTARDQMDFLIANSTGTDDSIMKVADDAKKGFIEVMDDDLGTPDALSKLFEITTAVNKTGARQSPEALKYATAIFDELCGVLGLLYNRKTSEIPQNVLDLVAERTEVRKAKNWARADEIRDELDKLGYIVKDTPQGPQILVK